MTKPLARLEFKRLRDLCLHPESGLTGHPLAELSDASIDDEVSQLLLRGKLADVSVIMVR